MHSVLVSARTGLIFAAARSGMTMTEGYSVPPQVIFWGWRKGSFPGYHSMAEGTVGYIHLFLGHSIIRIVTVHF